MCLHGRMCVCMCMYARVGTCACVLVCVYVCVSMFVHVHVCACEHMYVCVCAVPCTGPRGGWRPWGCEQGGSWGSPWGAEGPLGGLAQAGSSLGVRGEGAGNQAAPPVLCPCPPPTLGTWPPYLCQVFNGTRAWPCPGERGTSLPFPSTQDRPRQAGATTRLPVHEGPPCPERHPAAAGTGQTGGAGTCPMGLMAAEPFTKLFQAIQGHTGRPCGALCVGELASRPRRRRPVYTRTQCVASGALPTPASSSGLSPAVPRVPSLGQGSFPTPLPGTSCPRADGAGPGQAST